MKTHIDIDARILATVQRLGGYATKRAAVHAALSAMAQRLAAKQLSAMGGTFRDGFEPLKVEEPRFPRWDAAR